MLLISPNVFRFVSFTVTQGQHKWYLPNVLIHTTCFNPHTCDQSYLYAASVCSGNRPELPRCAIFKGLTAGFWAKQAASQTSIINSTYFSMTSPEYRSAPLKFTTIFDTERQATPASYAKTNLWRWPVAVNHFIEQYWANYLINIRTTNTSDWLKATTWGNMQSKHCWEEGCVIYGSDVQSRLLYIMLLFPH